MKIRIINTAFATLFLCASLPAHSQLIRTYENENGTPLFTNKVHSLKKINETYFPDTSISLKGSTHYPRYRQAKNNNTYDSIIQGASQKYGVDFKLIKAVIQTESGFNRYARSPVGAQGLMQLMPATARRFDVNDSFNPNENIEAGTRYLSWLIKRYNGNLHKALAGYNAGEGNVDKYGGIPPFKETQNYVVTVLSHYNKGFTHATDSLHTPISTPANNKSSNKQSSGKSVAIIRYSDDSFGDIFASEY